MSSKSQQLSKSSLIRSIQCLKSLYLYKNYYNLRDKPDRKQQQKFNRGHRVGKLAQDLFFGGKDCTPPSPMHYQQSVVATKMLVSQQFPVIYEAAFKFQGILVALDILAYKDGVFTAYEVKSSMSVSQTYLLDCAIQYYVIQQSGLQLNDFYIIYIDGSYVRKENLVIEEFFKRKSVLKEVIALQPYIKEKIDAAVHILQQAQLPDVSIGSHCTKPYPCDFIGYCWKNITRDSIWHLQGVSIVDKVEAIANGLTTISAYAQKHQEDVKMKSYINHSEIIHKKEISDYYKKVQYPFAFFDIEAFQSAIPVFENTKPYERIPFLYSLHIKTSEEDNYHHKEYFSKADADYRQEFLLRFLEDTANLKTILVYNDLMEKSILNYLANIFPKYKFEIDKRIAIMIDMEIPFKRLDYYHPMQLGSLSLKTIAAAMLDKNNPYIGVDVKDGEEAMAVYNELFYLLEEERLPYYDKLKTYCKTDTYVLTIIYEELLNKAKI